MSEKDDAAPSTLPSTATATSRALPNGDSVSSPAVAPHLANDAVAEIEVKPGIKASANIVPPGVPVKDIGPKSSSVLKRTAAQEEVKDDLKRASTSLPVYYDGKSDLYTLGSRPGMECVPLRSPADPYHYHHVTDQTKSLQELQNEVGALLEFRDLVIETFPDLKTKMASSAANSTLTGIPSSSSLASRREWEPGIRTRRKLTQKETSSEIHQHSSSLIRSRSNSHSGKKEPKSGEGNNGSVIQDSGFSTETSSSKETHSASSTSGGVQGTIVSNTTRLTVDTEDELWNLLDVIHRKSNRLREEVDALQQLEREKCRTNQLNNNHVNVVSSTSGSSSSNLNNNLNNSNSSSSSSSGNLPHHTHQPPGVPSANTNSSSGGAGGGANSLAKTFQNQLLVDIVNKDDVQILRKERDRLFDKLSEFEAEAIASRIRASKMQDEVDALASAKRELEDQLKAALSQKLELNNRIHDLHQQYVNKSAPSSPDSIKGRHPLTPSQRKHSSSESTTTTIVVSTPHLSSSPSSVASTQLLLKPRFSQSNFAPVKSAGSAKVSNPVVPSAVLAASALLDETLLLDTTSPTATTPSSGSSEEHHRLAQQLDNSVTGVSGLGRLDGLISSPARLSKVRMTDSKKVAAILLEKNIVELQRHLLTVTVQNQILQQRLDHATRTRINLSSKLDKSKEDIEDLKFRLKEKTIELEGTMAQLRVLESKQSSKSSSSSGCSPEHGPAALGGPKVPNATATSTVVTTSAVGIVSHQYRSASTSELAQVSPVHHPHHHHHIIQHHHHHQQQQQQQQRDLALRLQQTQVSTPSMKAMIPLPMDEIQQHSSSTESAQDQAERDSATRLQCPETPRRRPSKIPLPGTKGYVAPKPPTGRNFVASSQQQSRQDKSSPSPSGSLTNKSLNKSTGSLYMKSTGPSSITSASKDKKDASLNRPDSAQSWRRDTSLEKSRSSSIPVSKGPPGGGSPVAKPSIVSSSPQPKAKRDSLTTRVKNLDSLSRLQTASASTGNLAKASSKKDLSSSFTGQTRDRKQNASAIRRVSSASIGRGSAASSVEQNNNSSSAASADSPSAATGNASGDNGKARRTNTFRLAKPTLMPPLKLGGHLDSSSTSSSSSRGRHLAGMVLPTAMAAAPVLTPQPQHPSSNPQHALTVTSSSPAATARYRPSCSSTSASSSSSSGGSSPSSVTTVTTIESHSSTGGQTAAPLQRDLIGEYLAAKYRSQSQHPTIPPPIFSPKITAGQHHEREQLELAYKHPILLMDDEENVYCSVISSVGNERNRDLEVKYIEDNSIELLDAKDDLYEGEKESLIIPKPKTIAFHSLKSSPAREREAHEEKCRLVGKVNPNILKTWEQLSAANSDKTYCDPRRKISRNSLITVTSSENSGDKQSCLIFYRNQYNLAEEPSDFRVNHIQHSSISNSSTTVADGSEERMVPTHTTVSLVTSSTTTTTSSEGCYDFYDSIDDSANHRIVELTVDEEDEDDEYALAAGEGLADFTSLDRKKLMWSIDVE